MSKELYSSYNKKKKVLNKWCYLELQINTLQAFMLQEYYNTKYKKLQSIYINSFCNF